MEIVLRYSSQLLDQEWSQQRQFLGSPWFIRALIRINLLFSLDTVSPQRCATMNSHKYSPSRIIAQVDQFLMCMATFESDEMLLTAREFEEWAQKEDSYKWRGFIWDTWQGDFQRIEVEMHQPFAYVTGLSIEPYLEEYRQSSHSDIQIPLIPKQSIVFGKPFPSQGIGMIC